MTGETARAERMTKPAPPSATGRERAADRAASARSAAELRTTAIYYMELAGWQLRRELEPGEYQALVRSADVALALVTGRPADALRAALEQAPPVLSERPVDGELSSPYGLRRDPLRKRRVRRHNGVDLVARRGSPVHAAGAGLVVRAGRLGGYGRVVYVDHGGGLQTRYAHLQKILVEEGTFVTAGTLVGEVGSSGRTTGPHLHFEVRQAGRPIEPDWLLALLSRSAVDEADAAPDRQPARARNRDRARRRDKDRKRPRDRELRSRRPAI
jgi:murein DD-endopeptidase MepM/ murein hydrolase activator NlpD